MNRRAALSRISMGVGAGVGAGAGAVAGAAPTAEGPGVPGPPPAGRRPGRLVLGCQARPTTAEGVRIWGRFGVTHVCGCPRDESPSRGYWTVEELSRLRDLCEGGGLELAMVWEPFLRSDHIDEVDRPAIMLGRSPGRDRDIECFQKHIENCAAVGVHATKYNLTLLGVPRTRDVPGRGGASCAAFRLADDGRNARRMTRAGRVTADLYWERIEYFLERVVPVAEQYRVRLALHPQDPGVPDGYQGVDAVLGTVEGLERFVSTCESPYHGLNFCQGTVSEMLEDPGREIVGVIRRLGRTGKIFNVHFRNIRGRRGDFREVYPDEGDVDMWQAILAYREVGYEGMIMFDHIPDAPRDGHASRAFAYGYIRGLIQAAEALG